MKENFAKKLIILIELNKLNFISFKISFVITTLCRFQSCISYQGLQNCKFRFQCVQAHFASFANHLQTLTK
ncbi:hypothetical protein BpHYR1_005579 [Brachionus plicatilis]|uniref:Uncharacterized protein n=1 Tax=Brachionus plicatilis TaxID=10195 RepID=A0A3M7SMN6_BRAPC|nr:hypothetical protein BpHYR1_005579 [Brachionus plicatilis]